MAKEKTCETGYHEVILNIQHGNGYRQECLCGKVIGYTLEKVAYPLGYQEGQLYE